MSGDSVTNIEIRSGVNADHQGFLTVVVTTDDGRLLLGQFDPATARDMAMGWIAAAEAAEQDAAAVRCFRKLGLPDELAAMVITELRKSR